MTRKTRDLITGYTFTLPALAFMLLVIGYPIVYNWIISFQNMTARTFNTQTVTFNGLANYIKILDDPLFWNSLQNTAVYTVFCLIFQFSIGLVLALLFFKNFAISKPLRGFLTISWLMPSVVTALMFKFMLSEYGIINQILSALSLQPVEWLTNVDNAIWGTIIANSWVGIPFNMLLLATGLSSISFDVYESAEIDGACGIKRFFYITLPLLKQSMLAVLVLGFVYTFKVFDLIYVMTGGGPVHATMMLSLYSYQQSFVFYDFSLGATSANILFICLFLVGLIYLKLIGKEDAA